MISVNNRKKEDRTAEDDDDDRQLSDEEFYSSKQYDGKKRRRTSSKNDSVEGDYHSYDGRNSVEGDDTARNSDQFYSPKLGRGDADDDEPDAATRNC